MPVTVSLDGPEAIEDAIANTLRTNGSAYVDAVWAAWAASDASNGRVVPKVYAAQVVSGRRTLQPELPAYIVRSLDGTTGQDVIPRFSYMAHRFEVVVLCQSEDEHSLDVQVKRHLVAIRKCLGNNFTLDGTIGGMLGMTLGDYGKTAPGKDKHLMEQRGTWIVTVRVEESYL